MVDDQITRALGPCANEAESREFRQRKVVLKDSDICIGSEPGYIFPDQYNPEYDYLYSGYDWVICANDRQYRTPLMTRKGELSEQILVAAEALPEEYRLQRNAGLVGMPLYQAMSIAIDRSPLPVPMLLATVEKLLNLLPTGAVRFQNSIYLRKYTPNPVGYLTDEATRLGYELRHADWTPKDVWRCALWWIPGNKFCGELQIAWNGEGPVKVSLSDHSRYKGDHEIYLKLALRSVVGAPLALLKSEAVCELLNEWRERRVRRAARKAKRGVSQE